jgi:hypothetical protein
MLLRIERICNHGLYPPQALADAAEAFHDYCALTLAPLGPDRSLAVIEVPEQDPAQAREIALSCLNYALDRAVQILLESG